MIMIVKKCRLNWILNMYTNLINIGYDLKNVGLSKLILKMFVAV